MAKCWCENAPTLGARAPTSVAVALDDVIEGVEDVVDGGELWVLRLRPVGFDLAGCLATSPPEVSLHRGQGALEPRGELLQRLVGVGGAHGQHGFVIDRTALAAHAGGRIKVLRRDRDAELGPNLLAFAWCRTADESGHVDLGDRLVQTVDEQRTRCTGVAGLLEQLAIVRPDRPGDLGPSGRRVEKRMQEQVGVRGAFGLHRTAGRRRRRLDRETHDLPENLQVSVSSPTDSGGPSVPRDASRTLGRGSARSSRLGESTHKYIPPPWPCSDS